MELYSDLRLACESTHRSFFGLHHPLTHTISLTMRLQPFFPTSLMSLQNQNTADPSKKRERDVNLSQSKPQFFKGLSPGPLQKSKKTK